MKTTFIDSGVLIAAFRGEEKLAEHALRIIDDPERALVSSSFVRLELLPKARYHRRTEEVKFYEEFFGRAARWIEPSSELDALALEEGSKAGLSALDSLHVAAALQAGAEELATTERRERAIHRTRSIRVISVLVDRENDQ
ncbi:MAG: type II toxin-antitoxin system VapC family toxin [Acidobacteriota bacterium]